MTFPPLDATTRAEAERRSNATTNATTNAATRLRSQGVLLADQGHTVAQITRLVLRSHDMVRRVLKRFRAGGLDAVPRRTAPGRARTVPPAWEAALLAVIERDPHTVGVPSANWTTGLLADSLARTTGLRVEPATVRLSWHAHDSVCKRPTWTLQRTAEEQEGVGGNACG